MFLFRLSTLLVGTQLLVVPLHAQVAEPSTSTTDVVRVSSTQEFDDLLEKHPNVFASLVMPWSGRCRMLAPEFKAASAKVADTLFVEVDLTSHNNRELETRYQIKGYPTLLWLSREDGHRDQYEYLI